MTVVGIGGSPDRVGGLERVTGQQAYVADIHLEGELHVRLVTLDHARARIRAIDTSAALAVPGVHAVLTAADLPTPMPRFGPQFVDRPVIAIGETHYHGEPVAAVAAETLDAAEEAARIVRVDAEPLPAVVTLAAALAADAPLVQDPSLRPDDPLAGTNVLREHRYGWGDVDAAAGEPGVRVIEGTYAFPMVTQFAIEPHAFLAAPDGDGIAVWSSIQHPYWLQRIVAGVLDLPLERVRIFAPDPGGAFGGKQHAKYEPLVAFLARRTGRPVRLVLSLEETFQAVRRGASEVHVRTGFRPDGRIAFRDIRADYLIGAYADIADRTVGKGSFTSNGPYLVPAVRIFARSVLSHTTPSTAFRGFGNPQQIWAVESNLNDAARTLGIDPVALRRLNLAKPGDPFIRGDTPADGDWRASLDRAAELIGWGEPVPAGRGRGIAVGLKAGPTTALSNARVHLLADGTAVLYSGTSDMGQGARTIFAQIVAEELGTSNDSITVVMGDTAIVPYDQQTSASRSTVFMGRAIRDACREIQAQVRAMAARLAGVAEASVVVERGVVTIGDREEPLRDVLRRGLEPLGGEVVGVGQARKEPDPTHPLGGSSAFFEFNATAVEVEVDRETGDVTVTRHVTVSDVGTALNPMQVRGQDEGAAIMGLGHTLMERLIHDEEGRIRNLGAIDYRIPTSMDLPLRMESDVIANGDGPGPYGAKGMSEGALLCVAPAVAEAVRDATGADIRDLPLSPERVWRALRDLGDASTTLTYTLALDAAHGLDPDGARALLGGKAANLGVMARELGLPVPPGFVLTTETCRAFRAGGWPDGLDAELRARMAEVEAAVGRRFGDPVDPLLVSVRSGAPVSMPGMMDTILDLGLNDETAAGLARAAGDEAFARRCHERFVSSFCSIVGVDEVPADPWAQLRLAIDAVFRSWDGARARAYRTREGIPDDLGTAVTIQAMVFGNRGGTSATGVLFTRDPATGAPGLYGDVLFDAQGEDVVAGTHATEPLAALDERLPAVAAELRAHAARLERHYRDLCDIEFTIETARLWLLQVRVGKRSPQAALRIARDLALDEAFPLSRAEAVARVAALLADPPRVSTPLDAAPPLTRGLPASPGIASGEIVTKPDTAVATADAGRPAILVRTDTSPDDVHGMARAAGILTARGGLASHAAVVARGWGIPAVVGASEIEVRDGEVVVGGRVLRAGDTITIDGSTGEVFDGAVEGSLEVAPEARELQAWAAELGIPIGRDAEPPPSTGPPGGGSIGVDDVIRSIAIKGFATTDGIADALGSTPQVAGSIIESLLDDGAVASAAGAYRLTDAGSARAADLLAADRDAWGADVAAGALDSFLALDHRLKATVTAWQMRDGPDGPVVNDHADDRYDRGVLGRLEDLHAEAAEWLAPLEASLPRLCTYGRRLGRALDASVGGDGRYVASPRVDSYHGIWFELHEDLIRLAGRTREDEAAAGRA